MKARCIICGKITEDVHKVSCDTYQVNCGECLVDNEVHKDCLIEGHPGEHRELWKDAAKTAVQTGKYASPSSVANEVLSGFIKRFNDEVQHES